MISNGLSQRQHVLLISNAFLYMQCQRYYASSAPNMQCTFFNQHQQLAAAQAYPPQQLRNHLRQHRFPHPTSSQTLDHRLRLLPICFLATVYAVPDPLLSSALSAACPIAQLHLPFHHEELYSEPC